MSKKAFGFHQDCERVQFKVAHKVVLAKQVQPLLLRLVCKLLAFLRTGKFKVRKRACRTMMRTFGIGTLATFDHARMKKVDVERRGRKAHYCPISFAVVIKACTHKPRSAIHWLMSPARTRVTAHVGFSTS